MYHNVQDEGFPLGGFGFGADGPITGTRWRVCVSSPTTNRVLSSIAKFSYLQNIYIFKSKKKLNNLNQYPSK